MREKEFCLHCGKHAPISDEGLTSASLYCDECIDRIEERRNKHREPKERKP